MTFAAILRWEIQEYRRNTFVPLLTGSLALLAYVLSYVYGVQRIEYFSRIAFAIVPIGFIFLAQPQAAATERASARLLSTYPRVHVQVFWGRLAGAAFGVGVYLLLIAPMVIWYGIHFPRQSGSLALGAFAGFVLGLTAYLIGRVAVGISRRTPTLAVAFAAFGLFVGVSAAALIGYGGPGLDVGLNILPSVAAGKAAGAFVDMQVAALFPLATLLAAGLVALATARQFHAPTRNRGPLIAGLVILLILASAATAFSTTTLPYSNMKTVTGSFSVIVPSHAYPIGEESRVILSLRDPSSPGAGVQSVEVTGAGLRIIVDDARITDTGDRIEVPVVIRPLPVSSPTREVYTFRVVWTQGEGQVKAADQLLIGAYPNFDAGLRWPALLVIAGFAPAILRRRDDPAYEISNLS